MKSKYKFTREEHELILNLFIIAFIGMSCPSVFSYNLILKHNESFKMLKDCFPIDEICEELVMSAFDYDLGVWKESSFLKHNKIPEV